MSYPDAEVILDALSTLAKPSAAKVIRYLSEHGESYYGDILSGTGIPVGSLGRILTDLEDHQLITGTPKRGARRGRGANYSANADAINEALDGARKHLLG